MQAATATLALALSLTLHRVLRPTGSVTALHQSRRVIAYLLRQAHVFMESREKLVNRVRAEIRL